MYEPSQYAALADTLAFFAADAIIGYKVRHGREQTFFDRCPHEHGLRVTSEPRAGERLPDWNCLMCNANVYGSKFACFNCGAVATLKCSACAASICSPQCARDSWPRHKPVCRSRQAANAGKEWARAQNRLLQLHDAAMGDDVKTMQKLIDGLVAALASKKTALCRLASS